MKMTENEKLVYKVRAAIMNKEKEQVLIVPGIDVRSSQGGKDASKPQEGVLTALETDPFCKYDT